MPCTCEPKQPPGAPSNVKVAVPPCVPALEKIPSMLYSFSQPASNSIIVASRKNLVISNFILSIVNLYLSKLVFLTLINGIY